VFDLGAGTGALTRALVDAGARVIAVELHAGRAAVLRDTFAADDVRVVRCDLVDLRYPGHPFRVVANPPWALAATVAKTLQRMPHLERADLVVPRWLARRWSASPRVRVGRSIPAEAFTPRAPTGAAVAIVTRSSARPRLSS
jgi:23S rRNA (adenine-N6)-dimethyltransferase